MALKRRSALQAAEKLVARGRLEAAVKQYQSALEESPRDTGTLNRLGDLYARLSRVAEAVEMFSSAADHFTKEGFFVKAIAIYKKIIRLDPTLIGVYETLADLYHRQGLVNEARAQYQVVAEYYKQSGNTTALVGVFEKMVELEPNNPSHRLKLAEFYCSAERIPEAMEQYQRIATFMLGHGKVEEAFKVFLGAFELKVDDLGFLTDVIVQLIDRGRHDIARRLLEQAIRRNPDAIRVAELVDLPVAEQVERRGGHAPAEPPGEPMPGAPAGHRAGAAAATDVSGAGLAPIQEPEVMPELGADGGAAGVSPEGPRPGAGRASAGRAADGLEIVDVSELVSLEPPDVEAPAAAAGTEPARVEVHDETGEFEIDLHELEQAAELEIARAVRPWADPQAEPGALFVADAEAEPSFDPAVRADELLTEANVLANYSLESKAVELLVTALDLVPGHLEAGELLLHLHHQAGRSAEAAEVAQGFVRAGQLPEPLADLLGDWGYRLEDGRVIACAPASTPSPKPVEIEPAPADSRLDWLQEEPLASADSARDMFGEEDQFFDLAAELEEELRAEETKLGGVGLPQVEEQSLEEIVEGFKQGVAETLSAEDYDTHYNLGIAYREMGLVDEAIGEFQLAARSRQYLVDCCSLLGVSFQEKGFPDLAVKWYERGLKAPGVSDEEKLGLLYELGNLHLTTGQREIARDTFAEIYGVNSNYRDVVAKLEELRRI